MFVCCRFDWCTDLWFCGVPRLGFVWLVLPDFTLLSCWVDVYALICLVFVCLRVLMCYNARLVFSRVLTLLVLF